MDWAAILVAVLTFVVRVLLPAWVEHTRPRMSTADARRAERERLRGRVLATWGRAGALALLAGLVLCAGCTQVRTLYVPDGTPVQLRETIRAAPVWVLDADGNPVAGTMDIPEGWFALPMPIDGVEE